MKYRKKPVVIEAYQTDEELNIETLEGTMHASAGDYIITGVNGEQYPCKPDIFKKTYDEISDEIYDEDLVRRQSVLNILLYHNATQHLKMIKNLPSVPTIDPVKHGKWTEINIKDYKALCSECGTWSPVMGKFCPECGARMDGYVYSEPGIYTNAELRDYDFALGEYVVIPAERKE